MGLNTLGIIKYCCKPGGTYLPLRGSRFKAIVLRERQLQYREPLEEKKWFNESAAQIIKNRKKISAWLVDDLFVKRYNYRDVWTALRRNLKIPRPMRVLASSLRLRENNIPTPQVFAAIRTFRWYLPYCDYLVTAQTSTRQLYCNKLVTEFASGNNYRQFISGVVAMIVKMHNAGVEHGDLSLRNIFCQKDPKGFYSDWGVIDLDGCKIYPRGGVPESRRCRELARVISSFLRSIQEETPSIKLNMTAIISDFVTQYKELSGYNLASSKLDKRVKYLTERIRKDQISTQKTGN